MGRGDRKRETASYMPPKAQPSARLAPPTSGSEKELRRFLREGWGPSPEAQPARAPQAWAVGLSRWTLSFSNSALDGEWKRLVYGRTRALWLRSLVSATIYQALRHAADAVQFGPAAPGVETIRLGLAACQLALFLLAATDVVAPRQALIALNAFGYGLVELALVVHRLRPRVAPGDWLHVTYGLAWFVVPKMSALEFFPAVVGSAGIVAWWAFLSLATAGESSGTFLGDLWATLLWLVPRSAPRKKFIAAAACTGVKCAQRALRSLEEASAAEDAPANPLATSLADAAAGFALTAPVVVLFNIVAYSSEKSVKERFVLRSALAHEHHHDVRLSLLSDDVSSMMAKVQAAVTGRAPEGDQPRSVERLVIAALPMVLLAALGWFPRAQRVVESIVAKSLGGSDAAWAALSHVAGLTIFLVVLTKRKRFLVLVPALGAAAAYLTAQALPEANGERVFRWAGTLVVIGFLLSAARALRVVYTLLAFARRTLFLYPHLADDLAGEKDAGLLHKLVSAVDLPRPPRPGAVRGAGEGEAFESENSLCSLASFDSRASSDRPAPFNLPLLPLGATAQACAFCSHDAGRGLEPATHAVPVCASWASWYLWRARRAEGRGEDAARMRPCCDFSLLALERASLHREKAALQREVGALRERLAAQDAARERAAAREPAGDALPADEVPAA